MSEPTKGSHDSSYIHFQPHPSEVEDEKAAPTKVTKYSKSSKANWAIGAAVIVGVALVAIGGLSFLASHGVLSRVPQGFKFLQDLHQITFIESISLIGVPIGIGTGAGGVYLLYSTQKKHASKYDSYSTDQLTKMVREEALLTLENELLLEQPDRTLLSMQRILSQSLSVHLDAQYEGYLNEIKELQTHLQNALKKRGIEELYRQLMLNFPSSKILIALFALDAANQQKEITLKTKKETFKITDLILALVSSPLTIEASPLRLGKRFGDRGILISYLERSEWMNDLFAAIKSIKQAGENFLGRSIRHEEPFYSPHNLLEIYNSLANSTEEISEKTNFHNLIRGFMILVRSQGLNLNELTYEQIVDRLVRSNRFLFPGIASDLLSPSSLMGIFKDQSDTTKIQLKTGSFNLREIFNGMLQKINKTGLSKENAISAQQLYLHLMQLKTQLEGP